MRQRISRDKVEFNALKDLKFNTDVISFQYREKEKNATSSFCYMSLELSSFKKPKRSASDILTPSRASLLPATLVHEGTKSQNQFLGPNYSF